MREPPLKILVDEKPSHCWHCGDTLLWNATHDCKPEYFGTDFEFDTVAVGYCQGCYAFVEMFRPKSVALQDEMEGDSKSPSEIPDSIQE